MIFNKLIRVVIYGCLFFLSDSLFAQSALFVSGNNSYVGLEKKNMLFNAGTRFTVTQTGTRDFSVEELFDGGFNGNVAAEVKINEEQCSKFGNELNLLKSKIK